MRYSRESLADDHPSKTTTTTDTGASDGTSATLGDIISSEVREKALCLYAAYPRRKFLTYHRRAIEEISKCGYDVVLINSNRQHVVPDDIKNMVVKIVERDNGGYDWCAWSDALRTIPSFVNQYDRVLLTNDSYVIREDVDLYNTVERMRSKNLDLWSMTFSNEVQYHYQSFWMDLRTSILTQSRTFDVALDTKRLLSFNSIEEVIAEREVPLFETLLKEFPNIQHEAAFWITDAPINPYITRSKAMWRDGFPFIKMSAIVRVPEFTSRSQWRTVLDADTVRLVDEWLGDYRA